MRERVDTLPLDAEPSVTGEDSVRAHGSSPPHPCPCTREGWCPAMAKRCSSLNKVGLRPLLLMDLAGNESLGGVCYLETAKDYPGILLNLCPWCGARIDFIVQDKAARPRAFYPTQARSSELQVALRDTTAMLSAAMRIVRWLRQNKNEEVHKQDLDLWSEQIKTNMARLAGAPDPEARS